MADRHELKRIPVVIDAIGSREESDSMGEIDVPANHYWGAQTQRSLIHFAIGDDLMPIQVYRAYGYVKKAAAQVNAALGGSSPGVRMQSSLPQTK